jgi:hypothetical protein
MDKKRSRIKKYKFEQMEQTPARYCTVISFILLRVCFPDLMLIVMANTPYLNPPNLCLD